MTMMQRIASPFVIPSSLQHLEHDPYNLDPYPSDFDDHDESSRAESFENLIARMGQGNRCLRSGVWDEDGEEGEELWMNQDRLQILYTLVRKAMSLTSDVRETFIETLCETVRLLSRILQKSQETLSQNFRDAFGCHLYMLNSVMFLTESHAAGESNSQKPAASLIQQRKTCSETMLLAATTMASHKNILWQRGVADEAVVLLPCRSAYYLLERSTGVQARAGLCGDMAMEMIAKTVGVDEAPMTPIVASLMDLMHSHEHMAGLTAEICGKLCVSDRLAVELLREYSRLDGSGDSKANGIKNVAPFVAELAVFQPKWVLQQLPHLLPHFQSEAYHFRSSIVNALSSILEYMHVSEEFPESDAGEQNPEAVPQAFSKARGQILDLLSERAYDVTSFTRSTVLKAWVSLTANRVLPKDRILPVTRMAMDRLNDKAVLVRKQAMQLLRTLLENNPFMGHLDPQPYREKLAELYKEVVENMPASVKEAQARAMASLGDEGGDDAINDIEKATLAVVMTEVEEWADQDMDEQRQQYRNKVEALKFTQSALDFIEVFEDSTQNLEGMILSTNTSDVTEALRFFVQARHFQLPCAVTGIKRSLALMWSGEKAIRDEVLDAFVDIFIAVPGSSGATQLSDIQIANNLLALTAQSSVSELASIEEAMTNLVKDERIPAGVFNVLWNAATKSVQEEVREAAFQLVSMGAASDATIVDSKSRLRALLEGGLGDFTEERSAWNVAAAASTALQRIGRAKIDSKDAKFLVLERIIEQLQVVARGDWCKDRSTQDTESWFAAAEQAIKAIFVVSPEPERSCAEILRGMSSATFERGDKSCHPLHLARFFHVLGQIALSLLVYTENLVGAVRRGNAKKTLKKQEEAEKAKHARSPSSEDEEDPIEAELGVAAELEAENERKMIDISENEILGRGLISVFVPLLLSVVSNDGGHFNSPILKESASLALCKLMCVSSKFCEKHLPLLFTVLARSPSTTLKANTVVALGDLAFRFPNEVEPYTPRIYALLRDQSIKVRRHTMMVLTHLILNDMVKVKGNVCEIALCLRDDDPRMRDMSRLLFHELSKRSNNPVYNLMPDIVSQLSQMPNKKEDFRAIMAFLLGYIQKEKQNEMLTEKFTQRFEKCISVSQKGDVAYCLSLLKMTDRAVKLLSESFKLYKDALFDEDVRRSFLSIIAKAKKSLKQEMRPFLDEWEAKLNQLAQDSQANHQAGARANAKKKKAGTKKNLNPVEEDEEGDVLIETSLRTPITDKESKTKTKKGGRKKNIEAVDEDGDEESCRTPTAENDNNSKREKAARKKKHIEVDEDEDCSQTPISNKENKPVKAQRPRRGCKAY